MLSTPTDINIINLFSVTLRQNIKHYTTSIEDNLKGKIPGSRTSLVARWIKICLPMQKDTGLIPGQGRFQCRGATKPMLRNY